MTENVGANHGQTVNVVANHLTIGCKKVNVTI